MENTKKEEFISTKIVKKELDEDISPKIKSKKSDILKVTKSKENKTEKTLGNKIDKPLPWDTNERKLQKTSPVILLKEQNEISPKVVNPSPQHKKNGTIGFLNALKDQEKKIIPGFKNFILNVNDQS